MSNWKLEGYAVVEDEGAVTPPEVEGWDPADYNIDDVKAYVEENPDERDRVLEAERTGKGRVSLIAWLEQGAEPSEP